jgi:DNA-binding NtrC family response regulator
MQRDPEMGEALVQMVKSYTRHQCHLVRSDSSAMDWARRHKQCHLLLAQLEAEGVDGLALGSSLSEIFPTLEVLFFPSYAAAEQRLKISETKVLPELIERDDLLGAIERAGECAGSFSRARCVADVLSTPAQWRTPVS